MEKDNTKFTAEYARSQIMEFREAWGDRKNSISKLDRMISTLAFVLCRVEEDGVQSLWEATFDEWSTRRAFMVMNGHRID